MFYFGVCIGYQILFEGSNEHGNCEGLKLFKGDFENFKNLNKSIKVPHVGWNECSIIKKINCLKILKIIQIFILHTHII